MRLLWASGFHPCFDVGQLSFLPFLLMLCLHPCSYLLLPPTQPYPIPAVDTPIDIIIIYPPRFDSTQYASHSSPSCLVQLRAWPFPLPSILRWLVQRSANLCLAHWLTSSALSLTVELSAFHVLYSCLFLLSPLTIFLARLFSRLVMMVLLSSCHTSFLTPLITDRKSVV